MGTVDPSRAEAAKRFAKAVAAKKAEKRTEATGTVVKSGGSTMVRIDGAAMPTPCDSTVTLNDGDRVTVKAENHRLVITGNLTNNAVDQNLFATTIEPIEEKTNCIAITADGLEVGNVKNGRWVGPRCRMGNQAFSIIGEGGNVLSSYADGKIQLGKCSLSVDSNYGLSIISSLSALILGVAAADGANNYGVPRIYMDNYGYDPDIGTGGDGIEIMGTSNRGSITLSCGMSSITLSTGGISIRGQEILINGEPYGSSSGPSTEETE